jgi:protein-S-isoprenylcysteine O-methyltransferase Ste14
MKQFPDLPPIWGLGMIALSWLLSVTFPIWTFETPLWLAAAWIVAGFALMLWTRLWFRRKSTPMMPRQVPTTLIVEGPFRINRNPIYSGMCLVIFGAALWFGAISGFLPLIAFPIIITRRFILGEEAGLVQAFGDEAHTYIANSRRW